MSRRYNFASRYVYNTSRYVICQGVNFIFLAFCYNSCKNSKYGVLL
nr:MAG TPA: hypothetical protein [Caudoviricetes sp.]